jgi:broad specificity phosphatase PhoE
LTEEEVAARDPEAHARWRRTGPEFGFPGGESRVAFERRVGAAVQPAFEAPIRAGATTLLGVLHKGVIKVVMARLLGLPFHEYRALPVDLGSIHRLVRTPGGWRLASCNETGHLLGDGPV